MSNSNVLSLANPMRVKDDRGNDITVKDLDVDIQIGGGIATLMPSWWQIRDALVQKLGSDPFVVAINDDEELSAAMETVRARMVEIVREKLGSA